MTSETRAVFFDVDFTLIHPGPSLLGEGYHHSCAAHGVSVDPTRFEAAVAASAHLLDRVDDPAYDHRMFVDYTASIIVHMGGDGPGVRSSAEDIYVQWAANHRFELYDDVGPALRAIGARGLRVGIISNSHRRLDAFCEHFALDGLVHAAVSSAEHGYMKPHPSIFAEALARAGVDASSSLMVGDSLTHDVEGALAAGMRAALLRRSGGAPGLLPAGVALIRTLAEIESLL